MEEKRISRNTEIIEELCSELKPGWTTEDLERSVKKRMTQDGPDVSEGFRNMIPAIEEGGRQAKRNLEHFSDLTSGGVYGLAKTLVEQNLAGLPVLDQRGLLITEQQNYRALQGKEPIGDGAAMKELGTMPIEELSDMAAKDMAELMNRLGDEAITRAGELAAAGGMKEFDGINRYLSRWNLTFNDTQVQLLFASGIWLGLSENPEKRELFEHPELIGGAVGTVQATLPFLMKEFLAYERQYQEEEELDRFEQTTILTISAEALAIGGYTAAVFLRDMPCMLAHIDAIFDATLLMDVIGALLSVSGYVSVIVLSAAALSFGLYYGWKSISELVSQYLQNRERNQNILDGYFEELKEVDEYQRKCARLEAEGDWEEETDTEEEEESAWAVKPCCETGN